MDRTKGIGGSDANKIYNGDWLDLNRIKRGIAEPEDLSWVVPVQIGIATEKLNLDFMAHDLGVTYKQSIDLPQHEFMTGQLDAIQKTAYLLSANTHMTGVIFILLQSNIMHN